MNKDKLKVLINSIKTSNELAAKQIEINRRSIELLGEFITEPEQVETKTEIRPDAMYKDIHLLGGVPKDDKAPACLDGKGDTFIKPEDMKAGEWYVVENIKDVPCLFLFSYFICGNIHCHKFATSNLNARNVSTSFTFHVGDKIRKATQKEVLKYFPNELEVPTHGSNDAAYIQEVTDPQV